MIKPQDGSPVKNKLELAKFSKEHQTLQKALEAIDRRKYLTQAEQLRRRELQKQKLSIKDRMQVLTRAS